MYCVVDIEQFTSANFQKADGRPLLRLEPECAAELCRVGEMIKVACREQHPVQHPEIDYPGVDILVYRGDATPGSGASAKNTVVMSNTKLSWEKPETWTGMLDRSPCGTGTCAVMAVLHARGALKPNEAFVHESIVGSKFVGKIEKIKKTIHGKDAIVPSITGSAYITSHSRFVVDANDPFQTGYKVADIW